jgi:hypothetical protein
MQLEKNRTGIVREVKSEEECSKKGKGKQELRVFRKRK